MIKKVLLLLILFMVINIQSSNKELMHYLKEGNIGKVSKLFAEGKSISSDDKNDALRYASLNGYLDIVKLLLNRGADVNAADKVWGETPLMLASAYGHLNVVKELLNRGAKVNAKDKWTGNRNNFLGPIRSENTALKFAAKNGHEDVVKELLNRGAIDTPNTYGETALMEAARKGYIKIVELLLDAIKKIYNNKPLLKASKRGHLDIVKLLLERGFSVNARDKWKDTPLIIASRYGYKDIANILIDYGANVNAKNADRLTPLMEAADNAHLEIVELLIDKGADINYKGWGGKTVLDRLLELVKNRQTKYWASWSLENEFIKSKNYKEIENLIRSRLKLGV